jgi:hypothetical protein
MRNGWGDPPLCRMHALVVDFSVDLDDPVGSLIEHADRFLAGQRGTLVQTFAQTLGQILNPQRQAPSVDSGHKSGHSGQNTGTKPPPTPAPVKESPRDVLGFSASAKLTKTMVKERQRTLAKLWHPDANGSTKAMQRLNAATAELLKNLH